MRQVNSLNHTRWECKYHVVFIPKYRRKVLFGQIRKDLGEVFHRLARQRESFIEEAHVMSDHVHIMISIPPKHGAGGRRLSSQPGTCPVCVLISSDNVSSSCLQQATDFSVKAARLLRIYVLEKNKVSSKRRAEIKEVLEKDRLLEFDINAIDDLDIWLQCAGDMACFVLFMPRQTYTKCRSTRALEHISFPVLLI